MQVTKLLGVIRSYYLEEALPAWFACRLIGGRGVADFKALKQLALAVRSFVAFREGRARRYGKTAEQLQAT